jgi:mRNA interferase MazF
VSLPRGTIVWVDLGVGEGSEQEKRRPAVVVSNDGANGVAWMNRQGVVTVVPLTSRDHQPYPFQVAITQSESKLPQASIAQAEQVRSVDVRRISPTSVVLSDGLMTEINRALRLHLAMWKF